MAQRALTMLGHEDKVDDPRRVDGTARAENSELQVAAHKALVMLQIQRSGNHRYARSPVMLSTGPPVEARPGRRLGQHPDGTLSNLLGFSAEDRCLDEKPISTPRRRE